MFTRRPRTCTCEPPSLLHAVGPRGSLDRSSCGTTPLAFGLGSWGSLECSGLGLQGPPDCSPPGLASWGGGRSPHPPMLRSRVTPGEACSPPWCSPGACSPRAGLPFWPPLVTACRHRLPPATCASCSPVKFWVQLSLLLIRPGFSSWRPVNRTDR